MINGCVILLVITLRNEGEIFRRNFLLLVCFYIGLAYDKFLFRINLDLAVFSR